MQLTAALHASKTECGVGFTAVGNTCCDFLVMVGDTVSKSGKTVFRGMLVLTRRIPCRILEFIINLLKPNDIYIYIYVVPHRYPTDAAFYIFIQQIYILNILNMLHNLRFFLFKMPFIS